MKDFISRAKELMAIEAAGIAEVAAHLNQELNEAVKLIVECQGKVIFCGIGKSGHICNKLASTFSSIGIPSVFLHPSEGIHGDLGMIDEKDVILFISYSGETAELNIPIRYASRKKIPIISITGNPTSTLAKHSTAKIITQISKEACPFNLAPTASTTAALVVGDALGLLCATEKGYSAEKFAEIHPAGSLGHRLTMVKELMSPLADVAVAAPTDSLKTIIPRMSESTVRGIALVLDPAKKLLGVITDGDIRRLFLKDNVDLTQTASSIMNPNPKSVQSEELVEAALSVIEEHKIQSLVVVDSKTKSLAGIIHIQSLLKEKIR